jgi:formylglycine-generating enzyme required for sulfatase activity
MNKCRVIAFWVVIAFIGYAAFGQSGVQSGKSKDASLKAGQTFRDCRSCPEMVVIPSGSFIMGTPKDEEFRRDHEVQHKVTITYRFAVSKTEVTWDQWAS